MGAAGTKHHNAGSFQQQKVIVSVLEAGRPKTGCQQGSAPSKPFRGRSLSGPFWLQVAPGTPGLVEAKLPPSECSPCVLSHSPSSVFICDCAQTTLLTLATCPADLLLTYVCKDLISQYGHILRSRVLGPLHHNSLGGHSSTHSTYLE